MFWHVIIYVDNVFLYMMQAIKKINEIHRQILFRQLLTRTYDNIFQLRLSGWRTSLQLHNIKLFQQVPYELQELYKLMSVLFMDPCIDDSLTIEAIRWTT
jgi:hypothetical protein